MPDDWTPVLHDAELQDGTLTHGQAGALDVAVVRIQGQLHALANRCSHRGCSLHEGSIENDTITCPCHGSTFRLDGSVVKGPATSPQPTFEVRVDDGTVQIRNV